MAIVAIFKIIGYCLKIKKIAKTRICTLRKLFVLKNREKLLGVSRQVNPSELQMI